MITVTELAEKLCLETLVSGDMSREVCGGYVGDLLSWVMGRAMEGDAWVTVMGNVNSVAVAALTDVACIILAEDSPLDNVAKTKAESQGITVLTSGMDAFNLAIKINELLN